MFPKVHWRILEDSGRYMYYCKTGNFRASNFSRSATLPTHSRVVAFAHSKYLTYSATIYAHNVVDMYLPLQKVTYYYSAEVVHRRCAQWFYKCMYIHIH